MAFLKRLQRELREGRWEKVKGMEARPLADDLLEWQAVIPGPEDSLYEGGLFYYKLVFTRNYPFKPPKVMRLTPRIDVNIHPPNCHVCLPKIGAVGGCNMAPGWSPALTVCDLLLGLRLAMKQPNFADPGDAKLAQLHATNRNSYAKKVRESVMNYALPNCDR